MRHFVVTFNNKSDCYFAADTFTIEAGVLVLWRDEEAIAAFPCGTWEAVLEDGDTDG